MSERICGHCISFDELFARTWHLALKSRTCTDPEGLHYEPWEDNRVGIARTDASDCPRFYMSPAARTAQAAECSIGGQWLDPEAARRHWENVRAPRAPCWSCQRPRPPADPCPFCGSPEKP